MCHITFGGLDEIGNQIMPALYLHINLRPVIVNLIAKPNQRVINAYHKKNEQSKGDEQNNNNASGTK
jgi:hypothetical protein